MTWFMDIGFSDLWLSLIPQQLSLGTRSSYPPPCERMGSKILNPPDTLLVRGWGLGMRLTNFALPQ